MENILPDTITKSSGATLTTEKGDIYFDLAYSGLGYSLPFVIEELSKQVKKVALSSRILVSRPLAEFVQNIDKITPGDLSITYLCNSNHEAIDSSFKLIRGLFPNRDKIAVVAGSDTGNFSNGLKLQGIATEWLQYFQFEKIELVPNDINNAEDVLKTKVATVFLDPVLKVDGLVELDINYVRHIEKICRRKGIPLIVNESHTMCTTGPDYHFSKWGISPDIVILGEKLNANMYPFGAFITTKKLYNKVYGKRNPTLHGSTTAANPASCVVANSVIKAITGWQYKSKFERAATFLEECVMVLLQHAEKNVADYKMLGTIASVTFITESYAKMVVEMLHVNQIICERKFKTIYMHIPVYISLLEREKLKLKLNRLMLPQLVYEQI